MTDYDLNCVCCFFWHRKIEAVNDLQKQLFVVIEDLINNKNVNVFLFGSKSKFNDLCKSVVKNLKEKYPHIKMIYVRAEFPIISNEYKHYLL